MPLINKIVELRILTPEKDGNWLTNGDTYSQLVYLGKGDNPENWREITKEDYEAIMNEGKENEVN